MADDAGFPSILCADDDAEVLERLKEYFTLKGFIVLTATNGVEACLQVKRWAPRAVIMDLFIPRLGGIGALGRIRAMNPALPVIFTGDTGDALAMVADAGVNVTAAFSKPLDLDCLAQALARAGVRPAAELATDGQDAAPAKRSRILVVADDAESRTVLLEYLSNKGFDARGAGSGQDAVERAAELAPHIVLLDLAMAGPGGLDVLREIKAVAPRACVILVTAAEDVDDARGALSFGAADYITKPFPLSYLDAVLDVYLPQDTPLSRA